MMTKEEQWQPIETVQNNGEWFLAYDRKSEWRDGVPYCCVVTIDDNGKFVDAQGISRFNLTHWMPLPEPPNR